MLTTVITDGRGVYLEKTIAAAQQMIPAFSPVFINDSGLPDYANWLAKRWPEYAFVHHEERRGMAGAVRSAWLTAAGFHSDYVFHLEEDFVLTQPLDLDAMVETMNKNPGLAQLVLKRQPWSPEEIAAGGQIELAPEAYEQRGEYVTRADDPLYSFNPHLARIKALRLAVEDPSSDGLERGVTDTLIAAGYHFGYWGQRDDPPRCEHIGYLRSPGYRW